MVDPMPTASPRPGDQCDDTCTVDCGHCKGHGTRHYLVVAASRIAVDHWRRDRGIPPRLVTACTPQSLAEGVGRVDVVVWIRGWHQLMSPEVARKLLRRVAVIRSLNRGAHEEFG